MHMKHVNSYSHWLVALLAAAALVACDNSTSSPPASDVENAAEAAQTAAEDTAEAVTAAAEAATEEVAEVTAEVTEAATSMAETEGMAADAAADAALDLPAAQPAAAAAPADWKFSEGTHFRSMTASQGTSSAPDKIEVAEVFWYGCNHCYNFDPVVDEWQENIPGDVAFVRIPVIWSPTHQEHARLMYTAETLGVLDEAHEAIFAAIHQQGNTLAKDAEMVALFASLGVSEADFRQAFNSFGVSSAVKRAENLTRRYGIRSVPIMVVNGKYVTEGEGIKSFGDILAVTEELVERERRGL